MRAKIIAISQKNSIKIKRYDTQEEIWVSFKDKEKLPVLKKGQVVEVELTQENGKTWVSSIKPLSSSPNSSSSSKSSSSSSNSSSSPKSSSSNSSHSSSNGSDREASMVSLSLLKSAVELKSQGDPRNLSEILTELLATWESLYSQVKLLLK